MPELFRTIRINDTNLKFYGRFESGAELVDSSGNSNTLTAIGTPTYSAGKFGQGVDLATNQAFSMTDGATLKPTGSFSVGGWIKIASGTGMYSILASYTYDANHYGIAFGINQANSNAHKLTAVIGRAAVGVDSIQGTITVDDGTYHFVVWTWDGANHRIWVDAKIDSTTASTNAPSYHASNAPRIGCEFNGTVNSKFWNGQLDDVFLLNGTALSADQIKELYEGRYVGEGYPHGTPAPRVRELNTTIIKNNTNLKAYYRMEAGALTTDSSGNGYTLTNTNTVADGTGKFGGGADTGTGNTNKKLSITSDLGIAGNASMGVSFWVKMNAEIASGVQVFFNHRSTTGASRYFQVYYNYNAGTRVLQIDNSGTGVNYTITLGTTWHHIVLNRTSTTASEMYVDNVRIAGTSQSTSTVASAVTTLFDDSSGSFYASCIIDDVAVFNTALTSSEIQELYYQDAGPVALYHLNGNSTDFSGNNNHGTDTAMSYSLAGGKFAQGGVGNGTTGFILLPNITLGTAYTFSCWAYFTDNTAARVADCIWDATIVRFVNDGALDEKISFFTGAAFITSTITPALNKWYYIVCVRDGATAYIYINGKQDATGATTLDASGVKRIFGRADVSDNSTYRHKGYIDEVQIYNVAKDARWVRQQYANAVGKFY